MRLQYAIKVGSAALKSKARVLAKIGCLSGTERCELRKVKHSHYLKFLSFSSAWTILSMQAKLRQTPTRYLLCFYNLACRSENHAFKDICACKCAVCLRRRASDSATTSGFATWCLLDRLPREQLHAPSHTFSKHDFALVSYLAPATNDFVVACNLPPMQVKTWQPMLVMRTIMIDK